MVDFFSNYTTKILCLSVFIGVIQMILPKGKIKQNVLFTCMLVITIVLVEPLVSFFNGNINISNILENNEAEYNITMSEFDYETYYSDRVKIMYEENLRSDVVKRLEEAGYRVNKIECECDEKSLEPKSFKLEIETEDGFIQPVRIEVSSNTKENNRLTVKDRYNVEQILMNTYGVKRENININGV